MKSKIKIAIVDDHQIVIDGLKLLLAKEKELEIVFDTNNGMALLNYLDTNTIDILLTDIMMPTLSGYELAILVSNKNPEIKIIALSMNGEGETISNMIADANIKGYILKTANKMQLVYAINKVAAGGQCFSDEIISELNKFDNMVKVQQEVLLTGREMDIVQLMAQSFTNKLIAQTLFISERTVETHRKNIFRKTSTHTVVSLLDFLRKLKLID
jgi:two-component system, NarL family, nitrate/nitrite response regulator NarL